MNSFAERQQHLDEVGCRMCRFEIEELGPILGPELPPKPDDPYRGAARWRMTPEEWAGGDVALQNSFDY